MIKPHKAVPSHKTAPPPKPLTQDGERLSKRVAHLMRCSRREAEQYIEGGWVSVNGKVVEAPMARVTDQTVVVDPHASLMTLTDVTLLLHKPPGFEAMAMPGEANKRVKPAHQLLLPANHWAQDACRRAAAEAPLCETCRLRAVGGRGQRAGGVHAGLARAAQAP